MRRRFLLSIVASDITALAVALAVGSYFVFDTPFPWEAELVGEAENASVWPFIGLLGAGAALGSLISARSWAGVVPRPNYGRALAIVGFALGFTALGLVVTRVYWSRPLLAATTGSWLVLALAHRAVRRRKPWTESMVILTGEKGLADDVRFGDHADVIQVFDPREEPPSAPIPEGASLVVDLRAVLSDEMAQFASSCNLAGYPVRSLADVYEEHTGRLPMVHLAEGWELSAPVAQNGYAPYKRAFDLLLVTVTAPIWMLVAAIVWAAVKLDSDGPAIYKQERLGRDEHPFTLYKFRTMTVDAEANGPQFAAPRDDRLTRVGRILRMIRADEIPQLWNVLRGDLSLVGPRPERPVFAREFERTIPFYANRHFVRPGITGWAQVNYGYADDEADTIEKLTFDLYYVKHMSLWLDLQILGKSIWTVLSGFGAR